MITVEYPPVPRTPFIGIMRMVYLRTGGIDRDAGQGGKEVTLTPGQTYYEGRTIFTLSDATQARRNGQVHRATAEEQRCARSGSGK